MAEKVFEINLKVNAAGQTDLDELQNTLDLVADSVDELEKKKEGLEKAFKSARIGTKEYQLLAESLAEVNSQIVTIEESVADITVAEKVDGFVKFGAAIAGISGTAATLSSSFGEFGGALGATSQDIEEATGKITALLSVLETLMIVSEALGSENKLFTQFLARNTTVTATNTAATVGNTTATVVDTAATSVNTTTTTINNGVIAENTALNIGNTAATTANSVATASSVGIMGKLGSVFAGVGRLLGAGLTLMTGWVGAIVALVAVAVILIANVKKVSAVFSDLFFSLKENLFLFTDYIGLTNKMTRETEKLVDELKELAEIQGLIISNDLLKRQADFLTGKITDIKLTKENIKSLEKELKNADALAKAEKAKFNSSKEVKNISDEITRLQVKQYETQKKNTEEINKFKKAYPILTASQKTYIKGLEDEVKAFDKRIEDERKKLFLLTTDQLNAEAARLEKQNELQSTKNALLAQEIDLRKALVEGSLSLAEFELEVLNEKDILDADNHKKRLARINEIAALQTKLLKEDLKNTEINEAERVRINNEVLSIERGRSKSIKDETDAYLNANIAFEFSKSNEKLTNSIDDLNDSLEKSNNIGEKLQITNKIKDLVKSQELLNAASQVEVKDKEAMLKVMREYNQLALEKNRINQEEVDRNRNEREKLIKERDELKATVKEPSSRDLLVKVTSGTFDFSNILSNIKKTKEEIDLLAGTSFSDLRLNIKEELDFIDSFFGAGSTQVFDITTIENFFKSLKSLGIKLGDDVINDPLFPKAIKKLFEDLKISVEKENIKIKPIISFDKEKKDKLDAQIKSYDETITELLNKAETNDTPIDDQMDSLIVKMKEIAKTSGISVEAIENFVNATDKIEASNELEKQLAKENSFLDLQKALLGALSIEVQRLVGNKIDLEEVLKDFMDFNDVDLDTLLANKLTNKKLNKTPKEFKKLIKDALDEVGKNAKKERDRIFEELKMASKLIDTQIGILKNKINENIGEDIDFQGLTSRIAENMDLEDITELFKLPTEDIIKELEGTELGFLTAENIDMFREFLSLQQQKVQLEKDFKVANEEVTETLNAQKETLEKFTKVTLQQGIDITNKLAESFGGLFSSVFDLWIDDLNKKFDALQSKIDSVNAQIESSQSRLDASQEELKNANGARRKQILEDLDAERIRIAALQVQKEENEKRQQAIDKSRIRAEKEQQAIASVTNTINQIGLAITAIGEALKTSDTPSIILKLAAVAATVAAVTAGIGTIRSFEDGGLLEGNSHAQGGIKGRGSFSNVEVEGGEFIVNKKSTAKYLPVLDMINKNKFENGGVLPTIGTDQSTLNRLADVEERMVMLSQRPIYVSVTDINDESSRLANVIDKTVF